MFLAVAEGRVDPSAASSTDIKYNLCFSSLYYHKSVTIIVFKSIWYFIRLYINPNAKRFKMVLAHFVLLNLEISFDCSSKAYASFKYLPCQISKWYIPNLYKKTKQRTNNKKKNHNLELFFFCYYDPLVIVIKTWNVAYIASEIVTISFKVRLIFMRLHRNHDLHCKKNM